MLITRYRPRGVSREEETWDAWDPALGPSKALHAAVWSKTASPISWAVYLKRYRLEQAANGDRIAALAARVSAGETITLLCSSACDRESRCHRSILKAMIEDAVAVLGSKSVDG